MKIAIYGSKRQYGAFDMVAAFLRVLADRGDTVVMHPKLYRHLGEAIPASLSAVTCAEEGAPVDAALAVSLGGDGTFLRTVQWLGGREIPIVGVNTGHLGYLAALSIDQLPQLPELIAGDYLRIERRSAIRVLTPQLPPEVGQVALNEVAIMKEESASMINAAVSIGTMPLTDYRADGLIVCTSTGSTAYNLSVGGPIVDPTLDVCVLSPVAAHSLAMRPLVVGMEVPVSIIPTGRARHIRLALDGRSVLLDVGTEVRLARAPFSILVMQHAGHTFADTLREKLHWGGE
ncbi:MAG: NAD(+)/NADH kinase [Muribaculaceae bacterium]|nr:NAD(+)/NADH kinase [Muribaculaceae bacterium]